MQFDVLDKGYVRLRDSLPDFTVIAKNGMRAMDAAVVQAARQSVGRELKDYAHDEKRLHSLWKNRHGTPFEHAIFTFDIKAPVLVWWHLVRHRISSYSLQSGRYTAYEENDWYIPRAWRAQATANKQASKGPLQGLAAPRELLDGAIRNAFDQYQELLSAGVAREMARFVLPAWLLYHQGQVTINARSLINVISLRNSPDAQWETQQYAKAMADIMQECMPITYAAAFGGNNEKT